MAKATINMWTQRVEYIVTDLEQSKMAKTTMGEFIYGRVGGVCNE
jgi:hypothetical protein